MDLLLKFGADVEARRTATDNATALMAATAKNFTRVAGLILHYGADLFAEDDSGQSAFKLSMQASRYQMSRHLDVSKMHATFIYLVLFLIDF